MKEESKVVLGIFLVLLVTEGDWDIGRKKRQVALTSNTSLHSLISLTQMVSETLSVLTVHVIWKTKTLPPGTNRSPEEERLADGLMEQRASVLEKLVEYAVGTNSNTVEGVRRAVSNDHG